MRIAVVDQHGNPGGGVRFVRALVEGLAESYPGDDIALVADSRVLRTRPMIDLLSSHVNVDSMPLDSPAPQAADGAGPLMRSAKGLLRWARLPLALYRRLRALRPAVEPRAVPDGLFRFSEELVESLSRFDLVYLAWPFFVEPIDLPRPLVATFHDFNYRHDFGNFTPDLRAILDREIAAWLGQAAVAIVSTEFIRSELERFFPGRAPDVEVVRLATFVTSDPDEGEVAATLDRLDVRRDYVLYPCNVARHKNIAGLLTAYGRLRATKDLPQLLLCGRGTEFIDQYHAGTFPADDPLYEYVGSLDSALCASGLVLGSDVRILGYVSDAEVDALIKGARLVVSPSLYEAGSGPGLDAWRLGVPVALSAIPSHLEQVASLGTEAWFFDPEDTADFARVVWDALQKGDESLEMADRSARALSRYSWDAVARGYHAAFERAVQLGARQAPEAP